MKLIDLLENDSIIVQVIWGSQKVEFNTKVLSKDNDSIYVNAYLHNGEPLEVNINHESGVVCNIFADDVINKQRVSWKNVIVNSVHSSMYLRADQTVLKTAQSISAAAHQMMRKWPRLKTSSRLRLISRQRMQRDSSSGTYSTISTVKNIMQRTPEAHTAEAQVSDISAGSAVNGASASTRRATHMFTFTL